MGGILPGTGNRDARNSEASGIQGAKHQGIRRALQSLALPLGIQPAHGIESVLAHFPTEFEPHGRTFGIKGLLSRHPDPTDQRAVLFTLTEEGARLQKAVGREHIKGIHALIGKALSAEEFETLQELSTKLRLHMEAR